MKLSLLADENIDQQVVSQLRADSHEVVYVAELEPGIEDDEVLEKANEARALLLTSDKDFGELVFRQRKVFEGVILLRLAGLPPEKRAAVVARTLREHGAEVSEAFTVISPGMVRIAPRVAGSR